MNLLIWNARGLGNQRAFRSLQRVIADNNPTVLFIVETKVRTNVVSAWKAVLGFNFHFVVPPDGRSGGLVLLGFNGISIDLLSYSVGHIDVAFDHGGKRLRFSGIYGHPMVNCRYLTWDLMHRIASNFVGSFDIWLWGGDFNETLNDLEKQGGNRKSFSQMMAFQNVVGNLNLRDLGAKGPKFTWVNRRSSNDLIRERLDRFFVSSDYVCWNILLEVENMGFYGSDHRVVKLKIGDDENFRSKPSKPMLIHK